MAGRIGFTVNGQYREIEAAPGRLLSDVLRYDLNLTGTKIGCNEAECGACTVLLDGEPVLSCTLPVEKVAGRHVTTIEGLARNGKLHPLQEAFVRQGAVQCGFCTPGQIMSALGLLEKTLDPSEDEILEHLKDNLCRCGTYPGIVRAIRAAARSLQSGEELVTLDGPSAKPLPTRVVGHWWASEGALSKVTGEAKYADDLAFPGMLHGRALRAGVPHAVLTRLDVGNARSLAGVRAVLTAEDIPGERNHGIVTPDWPALVGVGGKVRYVGDAVALVAADTRLIADQALGLIEVVYQRLPVVSDPLQASTEDAPKVHEAGNLIKHIQVRKGNVDQGFSSADVTLEQVYRTPTTEHAFLEPECSVARVTDEGVIEVYVGSQIPYQDRDQVAGCLGVAPEQVRVIGTIIGGAFGGKEDIAGQIHAALLAQATGLPVKVLYDRHESMMVHPKRHATQISIRLGVKLDGTIVAAQTQLYGDSGAYASLGEHVMTRATTHSAGPYVIPHVKADCYAMYTNNPPAGAFRGFGVSQACFAIESAMDEVAERLGMNPIELRRKNALREGTRTSTGQLLKESVGLVECLDRVERELRRLAEGTDPFQARYVEGRPDLRRAWGVALAFKNTGLGCGAPDKAGAEAELHEDGSVEIRTASADVGQGLGTVLQIIAAEELGLDPAHVRLTLSDTFLTPDGGPTTASRQTFVTGNAVRLAAEGLRQIVAGTLAEGFDLAPEKISFSGECIIVEGRRVSLGEAARMVQAAGVMPRTQVEYQAPATQPLDSAGDVHFAYSFATQAAEVEVDMMTGEVRVLRVISANDVGKAINPLGLLGQIEGGIIMGIGSALMEDFIVEEGIVFSDRLSRYRTPKIVHTPEIIPVVVEHATREGPYGAKGIGEITNIPTSPAIANAVYNATGVRIRSLPVDQDWLARRLAERRKLQHD